MNMEGMIRKWGGGEVLKRAVSGMLPKNRLRKPRLERLKGKRVGIGGVGKPLSLGREVRFEKHGLTRVNSI